MSHNILRLRVWLPVLVGLILFFVLVTHRVNAGNWVGDHGNGGHWTGNITYAFDDSGKKAWTEAEKKNVREAVKEWNDLGMKFVEVAPNAKPDIPVTWGDLGHGDSTTAGFTALSYVSFSLDRYPTSVQFNTNMPEPGWYIDDDPTTDEPIPYRKTDFLSVAKHEFGHVLGLDHTDAFVSMYPHTRGSRRTRVTPGDVVLLAELYTLFTPTPRPASTPTPTDTPTRTRRATRTPTDTPDLPATLEAELTAIAEGIATTDARTHEAETAVRVAQNAGATPTLTNTPTRETTVTPRPTDTPQAPSPTPTQPVLYSPALLPVLAPKDKDIRPLFEAFNQPYIQRLEDETNPDKVLATQPISMSVNYGQATLGESWAAESGACPSNPPCLDSVVWVGQVFPSFQAAQQWLTVTQQQSSSLQNPQQVQLGPAGQFWDQSHCVSGQNTRLNRTQFSCDLVRGNLQIGLAVIGTQPDIESQITPIEQYFSNEIDREVQLIVAEAKSKFPQPTPTKTQNNLAPNPHFTTIYLAVSPLQPPGYNTYEVRFRDDRDANVADFQFEWTLTANDDCRVPNTVWLPQTPNPWQAEWRHPDCLHLPGEIVSVEVSDKQNNTILLSTDRPTNEGQYGPGANK